MRFGAYIPFFRPEKRIIGPIQGVISTLFTTISDTCHGPTPLQHYSHYSITGPCANWEILLRPWLYGQE
jgi:hypothetical protein